MTQKPVANALTQELEPVVEQLMDRHLDTEDIWFAHDYVPFDQGAGDDVGDLGEFGVPEAAGGQRGRSHP